MLPVPHFVIGDNPPFSAGGCHITNVGGIPKCLSPKPDWGGPACSSTASGGLNDDPESSALTRAILFRRCVTSVKLHGDAHGEEIFLEHCPRIFLTAVRT